MTRKTSKLLHKIAFLENLSQNDIENDKWSETFEAFAEIKAISSLSVSEISGLNFGQVINQEYFLFYTRLNPQTTKSMRILFQTNLYEIKRISEEHSRSGMMSIIALKLS